jgi:hypothetical protein
LCIQFYSESRKFWNLGCMWKVAKENSEKPYVGHFLQITVRRKNKIMIYLVHLWPIIYGFSFRATTNKACSVQIYNENCKKNQLAKLHHSQMNKEFNVWNFPGSVHHVHVQGHIWWEKLRFLLRLWQVLQVNWAL